MIIEGVHFFDIGGSLFNISDLCESSGVKKRHNYLKSIDNML